MVSGVTLPSRLPRSVCRSLCETGTESRYRRLPVPSSLRDADRNQVPWKALTIAENSCNNTAMGSTQSVGASRDGGTTTASSQEARKRKARTDGLYLIVLSGLLLATTNFLLERNARVPMPDFRTAYFSAECIVQRCDPYSQNDVLRLYARQEDVSTFSARDRLVLTGNAYPPSEFIFTAPFAILPLRVAETLWFLLIGGSFTLAAFLMFDLAATYAPRLAVLSLCFVILNSESLIHYANPGAVAVPLSLIAVWCFLRNRSVRLGIACLACSLVLKPQDAGLIWLYFILAERVNRKRALQSLLLTIVLTLPMLAWVMHLSPHWIHELRTTQQQFFAHGSVNDAAANHGTCAVTSLQAISSFFWPDPHTYNAVAYVACAPLLFVWMLATVRARTSDISSYLALASISALSLLPLYHRQYDAKIILLTLPALALLWKRGGVERWIALIATLQAFLINADLPWVWLEAYLRRTDLLFLDPAGYTEPKMTLLMNFPVPLSLLTMGACYLGLYWKESRNSSMPSQLKEAVPMGRLGLNERLDGTRQ